MNEEELREILKRTENEYIEYKPVGEFRRKLEIAKQLVAFANRDGGKILFGIKDNQEIEGAKIDFDEKANLISNIAKSSCSPQVEFSSFRFHLKEGDVFVIDVKRRKDVPHALLITKKINKKDYQDSISGRGYYIRTISGVRIIDDKELEFLFKKQFRNYIKESFHSELAIGINTRSGFTAREKILADTNLRNEPPGQKFIVDFLKEYELDIMEISRNKENKEKKEIGRIIFEILPFSILKGLGKSLSNTWLIKITKNNPIICDQLQTHLKTDFFNINDLSLSENCLLNKYGKEKFDKMIIKEYEKISIPDSTNVKLEFTKAKESVYESKIIFENKKAFKFSIGLKAIKWKFKDITEEKGMFVDYVPDFLATLSVKINLECEFFFPEEKNQYLDEHFNFYQNIAELIKLYWDSQYKPERFIDKRLSTINRKLDFLINDVRERFFRFE